MRFVFSCVAALCLALLIQPVAGLSLASQAQAKDIRAFTTVRGGSCARGHDRNFRKLIHRARRYCGRRTGVRAIHDVDYDAERCERYHDHGRLFTRVRGEIDFDCVR